MSDGRCRVLVVDERPAARTRLAGALSSADREARQFRVETAEAVTPTPAGIARVDCLVTGTRPGSASPAALAGDLDDTRVAVPLVLVAPPDAGETAERALAAGYDGVVQDTGGDAFGPALRGRVDALVGDPGGTVVTPATVSALNWTARELIEAETTREVAAVASDAASQVLDFPGTSVRLYDPETETLRHASFGGRVGDIEDRPDYGVDRSPHGRAFQRGETVVDDVPDEGDPYDREVFSQTMYVPIGRYGVLSVGIEAGEFSPLDVRFAEILAKTAAIAFEQAEQRERLRESRRELERQNERLETFAGLLTHDLRNPLQVATGRVELMDGADPEHVDRLTTALDRMERIIEDILVLTGDGGLAPSPAPVSLERVARESWETVPTADARLVVAESKTVRADEQGLRLLFENLFRNAVEHGSTDDSPETTEDAVECAPAGGAPEAGSADDGEQSASPGPDGDAAASVTVTVGPTAEGFFVEDDGPGIPVAVRKEVFDTGVTTDRHGTGLGLAVVEEVVDAHGWEVALAQPRPDRGARFEVLGVDAAESG